MPREGLYTDYQGAVQWSRWSYEVFFIATRGAVQTLRVPFNGLLLVLGA